jgi:nucleoside-diphosphate-sugar epimerase
LKSILITGGFGFIGTTLLEILLKEEDAHIHVVDNMSTSPVVLDHFLGNLKNKTNLTYDLVSVQDFFLSDQKMLWNEIYHLASPVGPAGVLKHSGNMVRDVINDAYLLIDYCIEHNARLVDISSSEIYGGGQSGFCPENTPKIVPPITTVRLEYAIAKLAAETAIINNCRTNGLNASIVRPFNVAGPRQSPKGGFVLPRFIQQATQNLPITVFGDGSALRAFTHVEDMSTGIIQTMRNGANGEAYNIGNPANKTSIGELAKLVKSLLNSSSEIVNIDGKEIYGPTYEEANDKFPDSSKAMNNIDWKPLHDIEKVIHDATDDYFGRLEADVLKDKI